jgi:hypothetical protein
MQRTFNPRTYEKMYGLFSLTGYCLRPELNIPIICTINHNKNMTD